MFSLFSPFSKHLKQFWERERGVKSPDVWNDQILGEKNDRIEGWDHSHCIRRLDQECSNAGRKLTADCRCCWDNRHHRLGPHLLFVSWFGWCSPQSSPLLFWCCWKPSEDLVDLLILGDSTALVSKPGTLDESTRILMGDLLKNLNNKG